MKHTLSFVGLALLSVILVLGCGKPEEPARAQKPVAKPQKAAEEAKTVATQAAPAHEAAEHREHQAKPEHKKPEPTKSGKKQGQESDINQALLAYFAKTGDDPKYADPHQTARIDLNGDGLPDALVLLENPMYFCGTGGCTLLVFKGTKSGFDFVSRSTLIRSPVLVSETKTSGWRDLIVEVSGGGIAPKQVALKYTGSKYPFNPSTLPPLPKNQTVKGTNVLQGKP